ncbi:hypothetical protein M758_2G216000 [Ceratodon purpureus]|nr:hypothetical protein M758_2G216000 [Ceratodon purpureus]
MMVPAWMYPVQGFYFFFRNAHRLWQRVARFVLEVILAIVGILALLFTLTFPTQRGFLLKFLPHWTGTPGAIALILLETAIAIVVLFQYRLESAQRKLFIDVLAIRKVKVERATGEDHVWLEETLIPKLVGVPAEADMSRVAKSKKASGYLSQVLTEDEHPIMHFLITLPLNFVPVVGNVLFCFLNSFPTAISLHHYYYTEMKGLSSEEFSAVVHAKKPQYQSFGFVASAFSLIPGLDVILVLTNAVGAALWVADMEKSQGSIKSKWGLQWYDKHATSYGTFGPSSSGESSSQA